HSNEALRDMGATTMVQTPAKSLTLEAFLQLPETLLASGTLRVFVPSWWLPYLGVLHCYANLLGLMTIASLKKFAAIYAIAAESFYTGVGLLMLTLDGHR
ncbi:MAG: hypothetical protein H7Z11_01735, partial [Verrucomicrobia bacterium]|nr:hypothetical protein [Leptolyngbya sp. ES-bin-22]